MLRPSSRRAQSSGKACIRLETLEPKCLLASSAAPTLLDMQVSASVDFDPQSASILGLGATPNADGTTSVSGWLQSGQQMPMVGVPVELGGVTSITDETGYFYFEFTTSHLPTSSMGIEVPKGDPWFDPYGTGTQTIPMRRAVYTTSDDTGSWQHPNLITSFIDASMVYGSDDDRADALRTWVGGKLKISEGNLLPVNNSATFAEGPQENDNAGPIPTEELFVAGDVRANENVGLTSLHTLMMREHNRLAEELAAGDPSLSDEELYQQARRLVGAMVQHITYNEYLPMMLGEDALPAYAGYDPSVDPALSTIFSGAAFRVGHTQLPGEFQRLDANMESLPGGNLALRNAFFNPNPLIEDGIEPYIRGMYATLSQAIDTHVIDDVRNFLFGPPGAGGMDLAAINIQRGRDLGLPGYNQARLDFGLPAIKTFAEVSPDPEVVAALSSVYESVDDIDVWVGGLAEEHVPGAQLGPLFQRIIADQFQRLRDGDRYWYENGQFTEQELELIRGTTLAALVERNTTIEGLQGNLFTQGAAPNGPAAAGFAADAKSMDYRTINGHGNNLADPTAGAAYDDLAQNFTSGYVDGISQVDDQDRPGAREVSNAVVAQSGSIENRSGTTALFVFWGQLIDHDLGLTPGGALDELIIHGDQWTDPAGYLSYPETSMPMGEMLSKELVTGTENEGPLPFIMRPVADGQQNVFALFEGSVDTAGETVEFDVSITPDAISMASERTIMGWKVVADDGSSFDPAAVLILDAWGNSVPMRLVQDNLTDDTSSFVLVDLPVGDFTVIVQGENESVGTFHLEASLAGDIDGDRRTTNRDLLSILDKLTSGNSTGSANYDVDLDGQVTRADLELAMENFRNEVELDPIYLDAEIEIGWPQTPSADITQDGVITLRGKTLEGTVIEIDTNNDGIAEDRFVAGPLENGYNFVREINVPYELYLVTVTARDQFGQRAVSRIPLPISDSTAPEFDLVLEPAPPSEGTSEPEVVSSEESSTPVWLPAAALMVGPMPSLSLLEAEPSRSDSTAPQAKVFSTDIAPLPSEDRRIDAASFSHGLACTILSDPPRDVEEPSSWSEEAVDWMMDGEEFWDGLIA